MGVGDVKLGVGESEGARVLTGKIKSWAGHNRRGLGKGGDRGEEKGR